MLVGKLKHIGAELRGHAPFTVVGALMGILFMLVFRNLGQSGAGRLFSIFHPAHVMLSAMVTASMFGLHRKIKNFVLVLVVGYVGSIGIATLSDSVVPHIGEKAFGLDIPSHEQVHSPPEYGSGGAGLGEEHEHGIVLGFIDYWYIVNPAAVLGVIIAYFIPRTKFPHAAHVLVSTWASSSYILMNISGSLTGFLAGGVFITLFIAVWLPCCISDIVFPLLFVKSDLQLTAPCPEHGRHSHEHETEENAKVKAKNEKP